jgi:hypothetical protein
MNCQHVWNREFLDAHLTRSWREGEFKRHREAVLFDREKSLLPSSQDAIQVRHAKDVARKEIREAKAELKELAARKRQLTDIVERKLRFIETGVESGSVPEPVKRQFIAACPDESCRGFLSTAYTCGVCAKQFCSKCRELKKEEDHTCDPALVATIKAILADSRPCPSCGTAISRVSGCDQMFCTQCDTAFSYSTGKVVSGVIHNPHYFERLAKLKKDSVVATGCGANGWPTYYVAVSGHPVLNYTNSYTIAAVGRLYQFGVHLQEVELPGLPLPTQLLDNTDLRVQYLLKEIDEKQFRQKLQRRTREHDRDLEFRGPLELAMVTILEFFVWLAQPAHRSLSISGGYEPYRITKKTELVHEIETRVEALVKFLKDYINKSLRDIGDRYANQAPQIMTEGRFTLKWISNKPPKTKASVAETEE